MAVMVVPLDGAKQCFRPLSWGLFFNEREHLVKELAKGEVFVPFLGDFFSILRETVEVYEQTHGFSSPFLGTFFQLTLAVSQQVRK